MMKTTDCAHIKGLVRLGGAITAGAHFTAVLVRQPARPPSLPRAPRAFVRARACVGEEAEACDVIHLGNEVTKGGGVEEGRRKEGTLTATKRSSERERRGRQGGRK